ncbi:MAG: hypothetical protein KGJ60_13745 [Verrucomicrobiota bacterium]|nr:hypothetical protein [Verrucomicrobiota bacterium]
MDPKTELEEDLVDSLGELGIEELRDWHMKKIEVNKSEDLEAFFKGQNAMELILHISAKLGMRKSVATKDLVFHCTEGSHGDLRQLCIVVPGEKMKMLDGIRSNFQKADYGYFSENNRPFNAEVCFYGNRDAKSKLLAVIKQQLENSAFTFKIQDYPEENGLRVIRTDDSPLGDFDWFCKVLGIETDK